VTETDHTLTSSSTTSLGSAVQSSDFLSKPFKAGELIPGSRLG